MADDDTKDDKGDKGGGGGNGPDEGAIRKVVADVLDGLFKGGKADVDDDDDKAPRGKRGKRDDDTDIGAQVERALKDVRAKDAATKKEQELQERLKALEEKTAKPEKAPRQLRRVTRFMWGEDDDAE